MTQRKVKNKTRLTKSTISIKYILVELILNTKTFSNYNGIKNFIRKVILRKINIVIKERIKPSIKEQT